MESTDPGNVGFGERQPLLIEQAIVNLERVRGPHRNHKVHHFGHFRPRRMDRYQQRSNAHPVRDGQGVTRVIEVLVN